MPDAREWDMGDEAEVLCSDGNWRPAVCRLDIDGGVLYWYFADGFARNVIFSEARPIAPVPDLSDRAAVEDWLDA